MKIIICMDRRPDGRKPVKIKMISCGNTVLYDNAGSRAHVDERLTDEVLEDMLRIRTPGQLEALREKIKKIME